MDAAAVANAEATLRKLRRGLVRGPASSRSDHVTGRESTVSWPILLWERRCADPEEGTMRLEGSVAEVPPSRWVSVSGCQGRRSSGVVPPVLHRAAMVTRLLRNDELRSQPGVPSRRTRRRIVVDWSEVADAPPLPV
ncbi:hypothetical protein MTO96_010370 [Rhipicephalus appendiculatus]